MHVQAESHPPSNRPVALITGASSGIGEALARVFAQRNYDLVLGARRIDRLTQLAQEIEQSSTVRCFVQACDVMQTDDVEALARSARETFGRIDVVVANAGYSAQGRVDQFSEDEIRRQLEVNVMGSFEPSEPQPTTSLPLKVVWPSWARSIPSSRWPPPGCTP